MRPRPRPVTVAVILSLLLCLFNTPLPWLLLFPGLEPPPDFFVYAGYALGLAGLGAAAGLWMLRPWGFRATVVVSALNALLALPGILEAPGVGLRAAIAATAIVAVLVIALVLRPSSRAALRADPAR